VIRVLFFGRLREELGCDSLELAPGDAGGDLDSLQEILCTTRGNRWRETLEADNVIRALNQEMVSGNADLADGDEVAFFPPVTGG